MICDRKLSLFAILHTHRIAHILKSAHWYFLVDGFTHAGSYYFLFLALVDLFNLDTPH